MKFSLFTYNRKNFWVFQVLGWSIFSIYAFYVTTTTVFTRSSGILPVAGLLIWLITGFFLSLLLRIVFLAGTDRGQNSFFKISIAVFLPLILTSAWIFEWNLLLNPGFHLKTRYTIFDAPKNFILDFVFVYGPLYLWTFFYYGFKSWYSFIDQKIETEKAASMLARANLQMLRYQLNPHFLFNSLNSIKALIHENTELAEITITSLSDFLRATLQYNERLQIPVYEELGIIKKYLTIEKLRYEERLDFEIEADEIVKEMEIPCFITQPLVENAIKHGLINNPSGIKLKIRISGTDGIILIEVSNSGKLAENWSKGIGLKNLLERLEKSFPGRTSFSLKQENNNIVARIIIASE